MSKPDLVTVPGNEADLRQLAWDLAATEIEVTPALEPGEFLAMKPSPRLSRTVIEAVNQDRRKDRRGRKLTDLAAILFVLGAMALGVWNLKELSADPNRAADLAYAGGIGGLAVWRGADFLRDRRQRRRHGRTQQSVVRAFRSEMEAQRPQVRVDGAVGAPAVMQL